MRSSMCRQDGFTLIELMIVILIISILVAIAVPVFISARGNAQRRTCQANLRTIDGAINTYDAEYGSVPPGGPVGDILVPLVLKRNPICPSTDSTYTLVAGSPPIVSCPTGISGHVAQ